MFQIQILMFQIQMFTQIWVAKAGRKWLWQGEVGKEREDNPLAQPQIILISTRIIYTNTNTQIYNYIDTNRAEPPANHPTDARHCTLFALNRTPDRQGTILHNTLHNTLHTST